MLTTYDLRLFYIALCTLYFVLCTSLSFAQKQDRVWCFGDSARIDFSDLQNPLAGKSAMRTIEPAASIADDNGNLLFYAGAYGKSAYLRVWNRNDGVMLNGDSIKGGYSDAQGTLILPFPGQNGLLYYLFTLHTGGFSLYYSIIDIGAGNGMGGVMQKNTLLFATADSIGINLNQNLNAVRHANGRDWWIITSSLPGRDYHKFLLTPAGITGPFSQSIGTYISGNLGDITFSQNGDMMLKVGEGGVIDLFDFDRCTGELSNYRKLGTDTVDWDSLYWSGAFSPDGSKIYVTMVFGKVYQYDLNAPVIRNSRLLIYAVPDDIDSIVEPGQLQLGPDNKIYVATWEGLKYPYPPTFITPYIRNLTVIHQPDSLYPACDIRPFSFPLAPGARSTYALPNMPNYNLGPLVGNACDSLCFVPGIDLGNDRLLCEGDTILLEAFAYKASFTWQDGTTDSLYTVTQPGIYWVQATSGCGTDADTVIVAPCERAPQDTTLFIPNTITPNGDGANDTWIISGLSQYPGHWIKVFNRNGHLLWQTGNYGNSWDGTVNGKELPAGVYFYILEPGSGKEALRGTISIIR